jgi:hypothetical protein
MKHTDYCRHENLFPTTYAIRKCKVATPTCSLAVMFLVLYWPGHDYFCPNSIQTPIQQSRSPYTTFGNTHSWLTDWLTDWLVNQLHGAEAFLRSWQILSLTRNFPHFIETEGSSPHLQQPATCPYPQPDQSSQYPQLWETKQKQHINDVTS